jgi:hypothetical protein
MDDGQEGDWLAGTPRSESSGAAGRAECRLRAARAVAHRGCALYSGGCLNHRAARANKLGDPSRRHHSTHGGAVPGADRCPNLNPGAYSNSCPYLYPGVCTNPCSDLYPSQEAYLDPKTGATSDRETHLHTRACTGGYA